MNSTLKQATSRSNYPLYEQSLQSEEVPWISSIDYRTTFVAKKENNNNFKIALLEPRALTRLSLSQLLARGGFANQSLNSFTVLSFSNYNELLACIPDHYNNLKLIIFNIGTVAAIDEKLGSAISQIRTELPKVPLTVLCDSDEPSLVLGAIRLGAQGFITTSLDLSLIIKALHLIEAGGIFIPNSTLLQILQGQVLIEEPSLDITNLVELENFTPRQLEVLWLLWKGKSNKVIAYELKMQESTAKVHVREIMRKLNATNRTHAVFLASRLLESKEGKG